MEQDLSKIKQAISSEDIIGGEQKEMTKELGEMQPSIATQQPEQPQDSEQQGPAQYPSSYPSQNQYPQQEQLQYPQQYSDQYLQQDPQQQYQGYSQYSTDTISDVAEQIVLEKITPLRNEMEKVIDFKNSTSSQISSIDERLKRIEKIIEKIQLSILQKVGDYGQNIDDIKSELIQTQKSFKSLLDKKHHSK